MTDEANSEVKGELTNDKTARQAGEPTPAFEDGLLDVGDGHAVYWRAQGPKDAPVMLIVHGGPGGAMNLKWADVLDSSKWRMVFFDQRGCGKSTPFGKLEHNGTNDLIGDMEKLRVALGIEKWALFGGSWGTTLALSYGVTHPERCLGFLLRGIFLARKEDIDWFLWDVQRVFPDAHRAFLDAIETASGQRPRNAAEILTLTGAPLARFDNAGIKLARAWSGFEATLSVVNKPAPKKGADQAQKDESKGDESKGEASTVAAQTDAAQATAALPEAPQADPAQAEPASPEATREANAAAISMSLLEHHYMAHELPPEPLLPRIGRIAHLPCVLVHGRFDMVCPADQVQALADVWPGAQLSIVDAAGHWTFEPGNVTALKAGGEYLARTLAAKPTPTSTPTLA
ncbi:alpha/beta fold hydrolase [Caballeronia sp. dw_19]|uniref:alpha/beta fold hydrolase n=1 Tax=Caballeronia sp. dw_19 TaxID=2719791 RepID=UPI001BD50D7B|nr:alpha/beta fold hydrolase [Caballeronia sp. dw_19]